MDGDGRYYESINQIEPDNIEYRKGYEASMKVLMMNHFLLHLLWTLVLSKTPGTYGK
jgi:hypothetical protein